MKKLLAILLSVLMLCTMIPFATVSAEGEPTVVVSIVDDLKEVNAGDEFQVEIYLMNNPGLTSAKVELTWDTDVFELVSYYDEDEEDDFNMIEVASKWNASSNKYITFGPLGKCMVFYQRSTAKSTQVITEELFYTATLKVKDDAFSGTYDLTAVFSEKDLFCNVFNESGAAVPGQFNIIAFGKQDTTITVNGQEPPACVHEYEYDCSTVCSLCGEESRPEAEHQYFYACDKVCMICYETTNERADHSIIHVEAKEAVSCIEYGNKEYWYCEHCGAAWLDEDLFFFTNLKAVVIAGPCISDAEYSCQDGVCINCGMNYIADDAHQYNYPCDQYCMICGELTNEEAAHNIIHVEAKAPTCTENGNIEYWYCDACDSCWDNANGEGIPLNKMMVVIPAAGHVYDDYTDLECNDCGYIREAITPIVVLGNLGAAVSPDVNGLGFGFSANVVDVMVENGNEFIAGAVIPFDDGEIYNLAGVGAILSNDTNVKLVMENVDDSRTKNVPALLLSDANTEDGQIEFAVRVVNIPNMVKNAAISARPYFIYTTIAGEEIIVYGDVISCSYNEALELASID